jgi:hypothetical protein
MKAARSLGARNVLALLARPAGLARQYKSPWNPSPSSTFNQQSSSLGETKWDAVFFFGS